MKRQYQRRSKVVTDHRARTEPIEREDPLNTALDAVEQLVSNIVAEGGEAPLRARLKRLLHTPGELP